MTVVLQISDPHFGTEQAPVVQALAAMAAAQRPDLVILSGDITQRARTAQFRAARAFTDRLAAPLLAIPGNHDIPLFNLAGRVLRPYAGFIEAFGSDVEPVHASAELLVLCVNTTRAHRHKNGEVSAQQIERVSARLASASAAQLRVVVVHQPIEVMRRDDEHDRLLGHTAAQRAWALAGADLVLGGHIHLPYVMPLPELARPVWAVQAGTAVSSRVRPGVPNSVNLLRWDAGAHPGLCLIEQWDYASERRAYKPVKTTRVRPARPAPG